MGVDHEFLNVQLQEKEIIASTKSACLSDKGKDSYVMQAINRNKLQLGAIRFSLGKETTKEDLEHTVSILKELVKKQRENR